MTKTLQPLKDKIATPMSDELAMIAGVNA